MTITLSAQEQAVLVAVFEQIDVGKISKDKLQADLGLPTKNAAGMRITRLRQKLNTWAGAHVASSTTFTAAEQTVLIAIFAQIDVGKVDKHKLQTDLGLPTKSAAGMRVTRLREKLNGSGGPGASSSRKATPAYSATKASRSNTKDKHRVKASTKRANNYMSDATEHSAAFLVENPNEAGDSGWEGAVFETPTKNSLARQLLARDFKKEEYNSDLGPDDESKYELGEIAEIKGGRRNAEEYGNVSDEEA